MQSAEENELAALPLGRVRRLMKEAAHVRAVTQEASLLVCKATELFLESLAARALACKTGDGKLAFADLGALPRHAACSAWRNDPHAAAARLTQVRSCRSRSD